MKWNWDFFRGEKHTIQPENTDAPVDHKLVTINGHEVRIAGAHLSDMEVAGRVRMLMRTDLDHESVCMLARDRIVYLADQLEVWKARAKWLEGAVNRGGPTA